MQWKPSQRVCEYFQAFSSTAECKHDEKLHPNCILLAAYSRANCMCAPSCRKLSGSNKIHTVYHCYNRIARHLWCYHKYMRITMLQWQLVMLTCWLWKVRRKLIYSGIFYFLFLFSFISYFFIDVGCQFLSRKIMIHDNTHSKEKLWNTKSNLNFLSSYRYYIYKMFRQYQVLLTQ